MTIVQDVHLSTLHVRDSDVTVVAAVHFTLSHFVIAAQNTGTNLSLQFNRALELLEAIRAASRCALRARLPYWHGEGWRGRARLFAPTGTPRDFLIVSVIERHLAI